jgi:hypothetical protein
MFLKQTTDTIARWSTEFDSWVVEDRISYCWHCNRTGQALSEWLPTFDLALDFLIKSGV